MTNQQSLKIINENKGKFKKPSQVLTWAKNQKEINLIKNTLNDNKCGYCSRGILIQYFNTKKSDIFKTIEDCETYPDSDIIAQLKYGKNYNDLDKKQELEVLRIVTSVILINDKKGVNQVIKYLKENNL